MSKYDFKIKGSKELEEAFNKQKCKEKKEKRTSNFGGVY